MAAGTPVITTLSRKHPKSRFTRTPKTSHKIVHVHETPKIFYKPSPATISSGTKRKNPGHLPIGAVQTKKQKIPTPRIGGRPVCIFKLQWGDTPEVLVRVLLDIGAMTDVISAAFVSVRGIPVVRRPVAEPVHDLSGKPVIGSGESHTTPIFLRHGSHVSRDVMEISPLESDIGMILSYRWC